MSHIFVKTTKMEINSKFDSSSIEKKWYKEWINKNCFSVQYHPEANPGPQDSKYLFEKFLNNIKSNKNGKKKRY